MEFKHEDKKRVNYRSWKSGKKWLYASSALAVLVGGTMLEVSGITPKILKYVQAGLNQTVAYAMSNTPTVLQRGDILPTDFYASVSDFRVPATVGQDFSNNATVSNVGSINPYWSGNTYNIPSATNSNAIANFNQPLDPSKNFSISGTVTVPDARVAAAGFYISDVAPSEIVDMLGVGSNNGVGSSGALKNDSKAYTNHYMLFAGFHNTGGYAAILASGTDYTRVTSGGSPSGNSKYMDDDYVGFGGNRNNVTINVTIDYSAATGIATVVYRHNSATTSGGVGAYDRNTKSAVVQFRIDQNTPVYLGIVGNGDRSDSNGSYTSRSTVNSITGSYLTTNRIMRFRDEVGNTLAPDSKILMPRGGRLGIGNGDNTTPYYFDKPTSTIPSGYTYLPSFNPTLYVGESIASVGSVVYKRDIQTGFVERINKATGQKIDPSQNVVITGVTKQSLSVNVPNYSGYYYLDDITGDAKNPVYAGDGSKVDFDLTLDDTSNGTNTTDSQEQIIQTYMMPSVQERVLNITKPDGTTTTEQQFSTTDTDFPDLSGHYVIPGYRAVIDGTPVSDAEAAKGIPGEPTDRTNNLKAATDSAPQVHTITYQADPQKATVTYKDATTGAILKTDTITGLSDELMPYDTATSIAGYKGYIVKTTNFTDGAEKFDLDATVDQNYLVELVHDSRNPVETKTIKHEVTYTVKSGLVPAPPAYAVEAKITYSHFIDQVTGDKITSNFADYAFNGAVNLNPKAPEYTSDHPDAQIDQTGQITFTKPVVPVIANHIASVSENTTVHYNAATDGHTLQSTVEYKLDDTINVTLPTDTIFYNKTNDKPIKAQNYKITNNSGGPVKISVDGFAAGASNSTLPKDFALNLNVSGNKVTTTSTKLVENGTLQTPKNELVTLANCLDQYAATDTPVAKGTAINNVATFTYGGTATTSNPLKLGYTLSLKFESIKF